jgi:hypothetical protein
MTSSGGDREELVGSGFAGSGDVGCGGSKRSSVEG